jgi:hypothetical protein
MFEKDAVALADYLGGESIVAGEGRVHCFRLLLPEAGAALDVRQQEGDGTRR